MEKRHKVQIRLSRRGDARSWVTELTNKDYQRLEEELDEVIKKHEYWDLK